MKRFAHTHIVSIAFLMIETALYICLLITNNPWAMFGSILLCFLYALMHIKKGNRIAILALAGTVCADYFLVLSPQQEKLWGMLFFLCVQILYAVRLQLLRHNKAFLIIRIALTILAEIVVVIVLKDNTDALAMVSLAYYANLIISIAEGLSLIRINALFPIGMILFLLCDTVIGLQAIANGYLPVESSSILWQIIYPGFNLAWLFYLPSQVLLALSVHCDKNINKEELS